MQRTRGRQVKMLCAAKHHPNSQPPVVQFHSRANLTKTTMMLLTGAVGRRGKSNPTAAEPGIVVG
jgi:hypothetical protein